MVGVTFGQDAGRVDSAPGRSLSFALYPETATLVIPNGQVFTVGRVVSTPYRRVGHSYSKVKQFCSPQEDIYIGDGYMHSPMEDPALL